MRTFFFSLVNPVLEILNRIVHQSVRVDSLLPSGPNTSWWRKLPTLQRITLETTPVIRFFLSIWNFDWRNLFRITHQMSPVVFIASSYAFFGVGILDFYDMVVFCCVRSSTVRFLDYCQVSNTWGKCVLQNSWLTNSCYGCLIGNAMLLLCSSRKRAT